MGQPVQGGVLGTAANLADLEDGDLKSAFDFRQVYATLLENWLSIDSSDVLAGEFKKLPLIA